MVEEFRETGFYPDTIYQRRHRNITRRLDEAGVEVSPTLSRNIGTVVDSCTDQLADIQGEGREPIIEECRQWLDDTLKAHFSVEQILEVQGISNPWEYFLLPEVDWISDLMKYSPIAKEAMEQCIEIEVCRIDYKRVAWGLIEGFVRGTFWGLIHTGAAGTRKEFGAQKIVTDVKLGYRLWRLFDDFKFATADIWDDYSNRKGKGVDPVRDSYSYYNLEYEENIMPYNRRTGQWYPQRRYGTRYGSRGGGYRSRSYGNRSYGNSYAPRRRRTYRRSYGGQW